MQPPGPKGRFLTGNLTEFGHDPLGFISSCARQYGDVAGIRFVNVRGCLVSHPDYVEQVLATDHRSFKKGRALQVTRRVFGNGLLTSEGEFWLRQRRLAQPAFHKDRIDVYAKEMVRQTKLMLDGWSDGNSIDVHQEMMALTLAIVAKTLFGSEVGKETRDVAEAVRTFLEYFLRLRSPWQRFLPESLPTPRNRRYARAVRALDDVVFRIIRRRQAEGTAASSVHDARQPDCGDGHRDLLSILLSARDEDGAGMTEQQLRDEVLTLFLAGHETTAGTLTWAWHLLAQHPEAESNLAEELSTVLAGRAPAAGDLQRLPYAQKVVKETLRLYPPAYVLGREALSDLKIGGFDIAAGTQVLMSQWVIHRDRRFFDDPERFHPGRWTDEFEKSLPKYAYFPFGGGPRLCIGNAFAMMEAVLVLATVAQLYRIVFPPGHVLTPLPSFTLRPKGSARALLRAL